MIHDAIVPVTCDNEECSKSKFDGRFCINMPYEWGEKELQEGYGWIIINGKHYCSQECADEAEDK